VEGALASGSRILPLVTTAHCPSAANNNYWPEMYFNMPLVDADRKHPYGDTPSPKRFGTVSPLDPEFFSGIDEFADELIKGEQSGKYSPIWVANRLEEEAEKAAGNLREAKAKAHDAQSADFRRVAADVSIQAGLGKFFAAKFRAGVCFALYERSHHRPALEQALVSYGAARAAWAELAEAAQEIYRNDITFGPDYYQRGHWLDRLTALDEDIADMKALLSQTTGDGEVSSQTDPKLIEQAIRAITDTSKHDEPLPLAEFHTPPPSFRRGQALALAARANQADRLRLRYRHVNQAEAWQTVEMEPMGKDFRAVIPADYADSPFPLQYYFKLRTGNGNTRLHPGLQPGWRGQPYFVVRQG